MGCATGVAIPLSITVSQPTMTCSPGRVEVSVRRPVPVHSHGRCRLLAFRPTYCVALGTKRRRSRSERAVEISGLSRVSRMISGCHRLHLRPLVASPLYDHPGGLGRAPSLGTPQGMVATRAVLIPSNDFPHCPPRCSHAYEVVLSTTFTTPRRRRRNHEDGGRRTLHERGTGERRRWLHSVVDIFQRYRLSSDAAPPRPQSRYGPGTGNVSPRARVQSLTWTPPRRGAISVPPLVGRSDDLDAVAGRSAVSVERVFARRRCGQRGNQARPRGPAPCRRTTAPSGCRTARAHAPCCLRV